MRSLNLRNPQGGLASWERMTTTRTVVWRDWPPLCLPLTPPSACQPLPWPPIWGGSSLGLSSLSLAWPPALASLCRAGSRMRGSPPPSSSAQASLPSCHSTRLPHHWVLPGPARPAVHPVIHPPSFQAKLPWRLPTRLTLAAGGLGTCPGHGLCGPAVRLCRRALRDGLHLLTVQWLLGREAQALCPSCQLFSLCGGTGGPQVTILTQPGRQGPSLLNPGTPGRGPALRQLATSTGGPAGASLEQSHGWGQAGTGRKPLPLQVDTGGAGSLAGVTVCLTQQGQHGHCGASSPIKHHHGI